MNDFQIKVESFMDKNSMNNPVENRMLDLFDEIGEVAKEINKMSAYGTEKAVFRKEIEGEIGDAFYSLISVANYYNIDMVKALNGALEKYKRRIEKGGHSGSENE